MKFILDYFRNYRNRTHVRPWALASPILVLVVALPGATLPVAGAAGLIYRMGRLFELKRPLRTALAAIVVFGSGLISYAVVLNSHAPAAALVLCACGCIVHVLASKKQPRIGLW